MSKKKAASSMRDAIIIAGLFIAIIASVALYRDVVANKTRFALEQASSSNFYRVEHAILRYKDSHKTLPDTLSIMPEAKADPSLLTDPLGASLHIRSPHYKLIKFGMVDNTFGKSIRPILVLNPFIYNDGTCIVGFDDGEVLNHYVNIWNSK